MGEGQQARLPGRPACSADPEGRGVIPPVLLRMQMVCSRVHSQTPAGPGWAPGILAAVFSPPLGWVGGHCCPLQEALPVPCGAHWHLSSAIWEPGLGGSSGGS